MGDGDGDTEQIAWSYLHTWYLLRYVIHVSQDVLSYEPSSFIPSLKILSYPSLKERTALQEVIWVHVFPLVPRFDVN